MLWKKKYFLKQDWQTPYLFHPTSFYIINCSSLI
uniref:Uncharacterized protein n=1 Tax=Rhizophora mucronata TaxID=61149 RepID=A0A2P2PFD4_RHIMU